MVLGDFSFFLKYFERPLRGAVKTATVIMYDMIHAGAWFESSRDGFPILPGGFFSLSLYSMKKNTEIVSGLVSEEHPFQQVQTQPGKAKKHRYERRKVRNILKIADWDEVEEYEQAS